MSGIVYEGPLPPRGDQRLECYGCSHDPHEPGECATPAAFTKRACECPNTPADTITVRGRRTQNAVDAERRRRELSGG